MSGRAVAIFACGGWWAPVAIKWGTELDAGSHTVKAQVMPYGRVRMLVRHL